MGKKNLRKLTAVALTVVMATAAMTVPAFAAVDGNTQSGGNFTTGNEQGLLFASVKDETPIRHDVSYYLRTGDKGSLNFTSAVINGRHTVGGDNVPTVSLPSGWQLAGYYIDGVRYSAGDLAGYIINANVHTLQVEIRTYPDAEKNGTDDRNEKYYVEFELRSGHKGELEYDSSSVVGTGKTLGTSKVPKLTDRSSKQYTISGYYVDGKKYTRTELGRLEITEDMVVEVRTYRNTDGSSSSSSSSNSNSYDRVDPYGAYDWRGDPGLIPNGYYFYNPYYYGYGYNNAGLNANYPLLQPQFVAPTAVPYGQYTVQFIPQNGAAASYQNYVYRPVAPTNPKATGYTFVGWSTDKNGKTGYWNFNTPVSGNFTLYGIWVKNAPTAR